MNFKRKTFKNIVVAFVIISILSINGLPSHAALGDSLLRKGTRHQDVQVLQQRLKDLGFFNYSGGTTTYYGNVTERAVIAFQRSKGLAADGIFGPASFKALDSGNNGNITIKPSPPTPTKPSQPSKPGNLGQSRLLRLGSRGDDVQALQNALNELGYACGKPDGIFGRMTYNAVVNYQRSQGLSTDGIVGTQTIDAINNKQSNIPSKPSIPDRGNGGKDIKTDIVKTAKKYLGTPYIYGGSTTAGFDCSGFTQFVYRQLGITIPRTSTTQARAGIEISKDDLEIGDLLIFANSANSAIGHTAIYLGNDQFIHSSSSAKAVIISDINNVYYSPRFYYGRRVY